MFGLKKQGKPEEVENSIDEKEQKLEKYCILCGKELPENHPGKNNPAPLSNEGYACDECNLSKVIPERMKNAGLLK